MSDRMNPTKTDACAPADCRTLASALVGVLGGLRDVVSSLDASAYTAQSGPLFAGATLGGHVRHCLDHARALVDYGDARAVDYDHRERGTPVETDPAAAIGELDRVLAGIDALAPEPVDTPLTVAVMPSRDGRSVALQSTLGRELAFVLSHTVHHNATVRGMVASLGLSLPGSFGYAPSTLAHHDRLTQAAGDR
ncbi:MAG: DinB family protein [Phycisphaerales bacterium]|nr:DinB family protein [Phycisphaerales bacterium]